MTVALGVVFSVVIDVLIGRAIYRMIWRRGFRRALDAGALDQRDVEKALERLAPYTCAPGRRRLPASAVTDR